MAVCMLYAGAGQTMLRVKYLMMASLLLFAFGIGHVASCSTIAVGRLASADGSVYTTHRHGLGLG